MSDIETSRVFESDSNQLPGWCQCLCLKWEQKIYPRDYYVIHTRSSSSIYTQKIALYRRKKERKKEQDGDVL